ncbi:hypothetical protein ACWGCI_16020 [Streptomyces sp. NPDC054949]
MPSSAVKPSLWGEDANGSASPPLRTTPDALVGTVVREQQRGGGIHRIPLRIGTLDGIGHPATAAFFLHDTERVNIRRFSTPV